MQRLVCARHAGRIARFLAVILASIGLSAQQIAWRSTDAFRRIRSLEAKPTPLNKEIVEVDHAGRPLVLFVLDAHRDNLLCDRDWQLVATISSFLSSEVGASVAVVARLKDRCSAERKAILCSRGKQAGALFVGQEDRDRTCSTLLDIGSGHQVVVFDAIGRIAQKASLDDLCISDMRDWAEPHRRLKAKLSRLRDSWSGEVGSGVVLHMHDSGGARFATSEVLRLAQLYTNRCETVAIASRKSKEERAQVYEAAKACAAAPDVLDVAALSAGLAGLLQPGHTLVLGHDTNSLLLLDWNNAEGAEATRSKLTRFLYRRIGLSRVQRVFGSIEQCTYGGKFSPHALGALLHWDDIPTLFEFAFDESTSRKPYRSNSSIIDLAFTIERGTVALWLIESVRLNDRYHTDHLLFGHLRDPHRKKRIQAYFAWWGRVDSLDPKEARAISPTDLGIDNVDWGNSNGMLRIPPSTESSDPKK